MKYFNETYRKREFLSRSEWADTYRATQAKTDEHVILKVLVRKSSDEQYINNLLKEVEIIKTIKNPNLIHVNNMFKYSGCGKTYYYIEGEYFKGDSLKEVIANSKIGIKEAVKIVEKAATVIKEFHNRNISFNFLGLENILMNSKEIVKVNTLSYLEHESFQIREDESFKENEFNPQKDIYDLGSVLYCLISGNEVFDNKKYKKDIKDEILIKIIDRATNIKCESRYTNINRMILDLKSYLKTGAIKDDDYVYSDEISYKDKKRKNKGKKKDKSKKEEVEKEVNKDKKQENKHKKGKLGKTLAVCTAAVLVAGVAVYGYEYLEKNNFEFGKRNISDETSKNELKNETKEDNKEKAQDDKKVEQAKKEEKQKEQSNTKREENKPIISDKTTSNKKSEITSSSYTYKKDNNTSSSSNNSSSNINSNNNSSSISNNSLSKPNNNTTKPNSTKPNSSKPNNNLSKPNDNQEVGNTTKPNEGNNESQNNSTNKVPESTPEVDNSTNNNSGIESIPESEAVTE